MHFNRNSILKENFVRNSFATGSFTEIVKYATNLQLLLCSINILPRWSMPSNMKKLYGMPVSGNKHKETCGYICCHNWIQCMVTTTVISLAWNPMHRKKMSNKLSVHIAYLSHDIIITHTCCYILWHMIVHEISSKGNLHKEVYEFEQDNNREKFQNATTEI